LFDDLDIWHNDLTMRVPADELREKLPLHDNEADGKEVRNMVARHLAETG
jgi:hypothetical protein